jgi:hypothetical protein
MPIVLPTAAEYERMLSVEARRRAVKRLWEVSIDARGRRLLDIEELTADEILRAIPTDPADAIAERRALLAGSAYRLPGWRRANYMKGKP